MAVKKQMQELFQHNIDRFIAVLYEMSASKFTSRTHDIMVRR